MDWFKPAWEQLSEDDRYILETYYGDANDYGSSAHITSPSFCTSSSLPFTSVKTEPSAG